MVGLCRLCAALRRMDVLVDIKDDSNEICEKLRNCCQLDIKMQDALPKCICQECMENLNKSHKFYKKVKEAQETLQALFPTSAAEEYNEKENEASIERENPKTSIISLCESSKVNEKRERKKPAKHLRQIKSQKGLPIKQSQIDRKNVKKSSQLQEHPTQTISDIVISQEEDEILDRSYEIFETVDDSNTIDEKKKEISGKCLNYQNVQEDPLEGENVKNHEDFYISDIQLEEITDETEIIIMPEKDITAELEYIENYEDEEVPVDIAFVDLSNDEQQTRELLTVPMPTSPINSWKCYNYLCFICDKKHSNFIELKLHVAQEHDIIDSKMLQYKCYDCQKIISRYNFFLNHVRSKHHPDLKLICEVCDLKCKNFAELAHHRRLNCEESSCYEYLLPCNLCFKSFNDTYGLQNHWKIQHSNSNIKSKTCNKEFNCGNADTVINNEYSCTFCNSKFESKNCLDQHIYVHVAEKPFTCDICRKSFKTFHILNHHRLLHTSEQNFKCQFCEKCFFRKVQKIAHERTHTGEKPFACNQCDKRFRFPSALNAHNKCHTGAKPYSCDYCDKTFADSSNFKKHVRRKHANSLRKGGTK